MGPRILAGLVVGGMAAAAVTNNSVCAGGELCGPGHETCGPEHSPRAVIRIQDATCDMNDPNAPFYLNGVHHVFYQKHVALSNGGKGFGPVWAHAVSRDLVRWTALPVAVWNGPDDYSAKAVFTGSATVFEDGSVALAYAGRGWPNAFGAATPEDPRDPFLTNWTKRATPLVQRTDDDPSTAWRAPDGTWRCVAKGGGNGGAGIYGSRSRAFLDAWSSLGSSNLPSGECPSLFPNPGAGPGDPTHVHFYGKFSAYYHVGYWSDAPSPGVWRTATGAPVVACSRGGVDDDARECRRLDRGAWYAPKDYAFNGRRIVFGWLKGVAHGALSLPRELRYEPETGVLTSFPVDELKALRGAAPLASRTGVSLARESLALTWDPPASGAVEVLVR